MKMYTPSYKNINKSLMTGTHNKDNNLTATLIDGAVVYLNNWKRKEEHTDKNMRWEIQKIAQKIEHELDCSEYNIFYTKKYYFFCVLILQNIRRY